MCLFQNVPIDGHIIIFNTKLHHNTSATNAIDIVFAVLSGNGLTVAFIRNKRLHLLVDSSWFKFIISYSEIIRNPESHEYLLSRNVKYTAQT